MAWEYALLTHAAKEAGGPGLWVESIKAAGRAAGRRDMAPLVALAFGGGLGIGAVLMKAHDLLSRKGQAIEAASDEGEAKIMEMGQNPCGTDDCVDNCKSEERGKND